MKLTRILKIAAPAAAVLCLYPLTALFGAFANVTPVQGMIFTLVTVLTVWYAMAARRCCEYIEIHNELIGRIVHILLGAVPVIFAYIMIHGLTQAKKTIIFFAEAAVIAAYIIGSRAVYKSYREIFPAPLFAVEAAGDVISYGVLVLGDRSCNADMFCVTFGIISAVFVCLCSQGSIDANMGRIRRGNEYLPPKIRSYSMKLLGIVGIFAVILYLLRDVIVGFINMVFGLFKLIITGILRLSEWYASLFETPEDMGSAADDAAETAIDAAPNELLNMLINIGLVVILALIIWKFREQIYDGFMRLCRSVSRKLRELMSRRADNGDMPEEGYSDAAEYFSPAEREKKEKYIPPATAKKWKSRFRKYRSMKSGEDKLRTGYGLAADGLRLCGEDIPDSLTAEEIGSVISAYSESYPPVCAEYENVRYGHGATDELKSSEKLLEDILYGISEKMK